MSEEQKKFVVLSEMRAGSHMIMNLLNSHPGVFCHPDFLTEDIEWRGLKWLCDVGYTPACDEPMDACGFLLKTKTELFKKVITKTEPKVIYIVRNSKLEMFLSRKMAHLFGCYEKDSEDIKVTIDNARQFRNECAPIVLDINDMERYFEEQMLKDKRTIRFLHDHSYLRIEYEMLCKEPRNTSGFWQMIFRPKEERGLSNLFFIDDSPRYSHPKIESRESRAS